MSVPFGSFPFDASGVDSYAHPQFINAQRAPTTQDIYPPGTEWMYTTGSTRTIYITTGAGVWAEGGNVQATTTIAGITRYATASEVLNGTGTNNAALAADVYALAQTIVVGAVPAATETNSGIAEIATQIETDAGVDDARIVTPFKLKNYIGATGAPGSFTDLTATGTVSFTGATGGITMTSATASSFGTTGAGIDLTLSSAAGRVIVNGEEAAANAVTIFSAAGGLDVNVALQMNLDTSQNAADAIVINASAGGIDITAAGGGVNENIDISNTAGAVIVTAGVNAAQAIYLHANGGVTETIQLHADQGTAVNSLNLLSDVGGITLKATGFVSSDAINIEADAGGFDVNAALAINIDSSQAAATAISLIASGVAGGITMTTGTGGILPTTSGKITAISTSNSAEAIELHANGGVTETVRIRSDQGTSVTSIDILSDVGGITLTAGLATPDAININATAGGVDIDGALQVNIASAQAAATAIVLEATNAAGGFDVNAGTGGFILDTTGAISLDATAASNLTVTGAFALDVITTLGKLSLQSGQNAADSVEIKSLLGGIDILAVGAGAGEDIDIVATGSSVNISATENDAGAITIRTNGGVTEAITVTNSQGTGASSIALTSTAGGITFTAGLATDDAFNIVAGGGGIDIDVAGEIDIVTTEANADSINMTSAGGIDITATGAATKDIDIVCTSGSVNISGGESVIDALVLTAGGAAGGIQLVSGTNGILLSSGLKVKVTAVVTGVDASPYALLGTDYFVSTDTGAGIMTITLPAAPATGRAVVIYDAGGAAAGSNITIDGNGKNIAAGGTAAATKLINTAYESYNLVYNGTLWLGQNIV